MKRWVFDLDGTLIDSFGFYIAIVKDIFAGYGVALEQQHLNDCLGQPASKFFAAHLRGKSLDEPMRVLRTRTNEDTQRIQAFSGIKTALRHLSDRGEPIAIWTSRDLESATLILKHTSLGEHINFCISGSCIVNHKPHPEGLLKISERFACDPTDLTVVGDHDYDMQAAKKVGAKAVRASWHGYNPPEDCPQADFHFHNVEDFYSFLSSIRSNGNLL